MAAIIEIRDFPSNTPDIFLNSEGRLLLDLGEAFSFSLTKAATEGNEVNRIKREGTASFQVPLTEKNLWVFRKWIFPNNLERDFTRIRVYAYDGTHQLAEDRLDVLSVDLREKTVEIGLFESEELGVVDGANGLFLNSLDFGTFQFTAMNLQNNWAGAVWDGTGEDFYFGLIHYGNFVVDIDEVSPEDFRPLLSVPGTLVKGFCALGWVFESPLLECDWFKRLWWYGLGKEYYKTSDWGRLVRVDVEMSADLFVNTNLQVLTFDVETYDVGGNHSISTYSIFTQTQPRPGFLIYRVTGQIENAGGVDVTLNVVVSLIGGGDLEYFPLIVGAGQTVDVNVEWTAEYSEGDQFTISVGSVTGPITVLAGFRFTVDPEEKYYYLGDVFPIAESIDPAYTFLNFLEGLAHLGFRFEIDRGARTVTMYQPEDGQIFGEGPFDGYYRPAHSATDLTDITEANSAVFEFPKEDIPETLVIGFAKSTDKYIESLEIPEDFPLYAKRVTFDAGVRGSVEYSENPFFEATANVMWFGDAEPKISSPAMWDNNEAERSFEIAPRILYAAGLVAQTDPGGAGARQWSYLGGLVSNMPYVFQVPGATVGDPPAFPNAYIVYDDETFSADSLWNLFLKGDNRFYKDLPTVSVLMSLTNRDYHNFSFRDRVIIEILGRPTVFKVLAVKDFQTDLSNPTPITLQIDPADAC